ncbi:hypothetical protein RQP46_008058 [Phenoliferia psychrophenolica]
MATIHSLAPEILLDIFELAHDPRKPSTMCAASLVCRAWRDPAQRTLFLDIAIPAIGTMFTIKIHHWELYLINRLHTPRRVVLWDPPNDQSVRSNWDWSSYIEASVLELSITIINPHAAGPADDLLTFLDNVQNLHHLTFRLKEGMNYGDIFKLECFLQSLAGSLPASIKRMSVKNLSSVPGPVGLPLQSLEFSPIMELLTGGRLSNLARLYLPDCKRNDVEDEAAAAELLAECERRSIRVVCWEDFL